MTPSHSRAPEDLTLDLVVNHWALTRPDAPVLEMTEGGAEQLTWFQFEDAIAGLAGVLRASVQPGQTVGVICSDDADFHILVNALWRCGAAVLLIDRNWGPAIVRDLLALLDCRLVFGRAPAPGRPEVDSSPYQARVSGGVQRCATPQAGLHPVALYATTSGTTDNPKCVAITHAKIRSAYRNCLDAHDFSAVARAASLFELNSLGVMGICFLLPREVGAATLVLPKFRIGNLSTTWSRVLASADFVYVVPPLLRLLKVVNCRTERASPLPLLTFCASAPVTQEELQAFEARFPVRVFNAYGLTELTFAVFFGDRGENDRASDTIGPPIRIEATLIGDSGEEVMGDGRGELVISGSMLTDGYFRNAAATAESWTAMGLKTGDIAERVGRRYFIRGRKKDVVLRGGYTYHLHEIEHYLRRAPDVVEVCAFKGRDLSSGDELCVMVQAKAPCSSDFYLRWIRANMGPAKLPNVLYVSTQDMPRNSNGKILRNQLAQAHLSRVAGSLDETGANLTSPGGGTQ